jgi:hypothetical protein
MRRERIIAPLRVRSAQTYEHYVYFVVFKDNRFVLDAIEIIPEGNVITIATKSLFGLATGALRAVLRVRKIGIDAVVDMEFLTRFSAILTFTTGQIARWLSYFF